MSTQRPPNTANIHRPQWELQYFGRPQSQNGDGPYTKLELAISANKERIVISERQFPNCRNAGQVGMFKDEVIELMRLLGKEFVLDALADL